MFVQNLNSAQQSALIYSAKEVMNADGVMHKNQLFVLDLLQKQSNLDIEERSFSLEEIGSLFTTNREKFSFLLELISVALSDGEWHEQENMLIKQFAHQLGVSDEQIATLKQWVEKQFAVYKEAEALLNS